MVNRQQRWGESGVHHVLAPSDTMHVLWGSPGIEAKAKEAMQARKGQDAREDRKKAGSSTDGT